MPKDPSRSAHPGEFIRNHVIPPRMSVKEAAGKLDVSRQALSNLVNGNSSLSKDMAVRLEKAFPRGQARDLLERQAAYDRQSLHEKEKTTTVNPYVGRFLGITAQDIHSWADEDRDAQNSLPELVRILIHSTGSNLHSVAFPVGRFGFDGEVVSGGPTPWIPLGRSVWELSTRQDTKVKAEEDYEKRLDSYDGSLHEMAECTFVFVTSRKWFKKKDWERDKNLECPWRQVRVLDATDLEQWLEVSIAGQLWLGPRLHKPRDGIETLDQCWHEWETASEPMMTSHIFESSISAHRTKFRNWLEKPCERPFVVTADSRLEALAFLSCLFRDKSIPEQKRDIAAVITLPKYVRELAEFSVSMIPIINAEEAERELARIYRKLHCIIVRPRNAVDSKPDIALDLLAYDTFSNAVAAMGISGNRIELLANESGRSPTVLRRRLSILDAIKKPVWARDPQIARTLIPLTLIGAWHDQSESDREVVSFLAEKDYNRDIAPKISLLLELDSSPVWSIGPYRGMTSKIDALFAIRRYLLECDLDNFFWLAEYVLSESDPALDLPKDKRWAAELYGKVRDHSAALRDGICETLVLFSVHGRILFPSHIHPSARVSALIEKLLVPLSLDKFLSHERDLPNYAEAAPDTFLSLLEADLKSEQPILMEILNSADSDLFDHYPRTGLLRALECLAWRHLGRASSILAQLSEKQIEEQWDNSPITSLKSIHRSEGPQTTASIEERKEVLGMLVARFPEVGWKICIEQVKTGGVMGIDCYRPRWRSDADTGHEGVVEDMPDKFARTALDLLIGWRDHEERKLGDLVETLEKLPSDTQSVIWDLIDNWAHSSANDWAKAGVRERIRRYALTYDPLHAELRSKYGNQALTAYQNLRSSDPTVRHGWLFANRWIAASEDEKVHRDFDPDKRSERIHALRNAAAKEIWQQCGFDGITEILARSHDPDLLGEVLGSVLKETKAQVDFLRRCLAVHGDLDRRISGCMRGFLMSIGKDHRSTVLSMIGGEQEVHDPVHLFICAPFQSETWHLVDKHGDNVRSRYWKNVAPHWQMHSESERIEIVDRLLEVNRPRAAFNAVSMNWSHMETSRLKRLLNAVARVHVEPEDQYRLKSREISDALDVLDRRKHVTLDEMARLEFLFIHALRRTRHGMPNLEKQVAKTPRLFFQMVAYACDRDDKGQDPPEMRIEDVEDRDAQVSACFSFLSKMSRIPGSAKNRRLDAVKLIDWVTEVRKMCAKYSRVEAGDEMIGQLLSRAGHDDIRAWPSVTICEVLQQISSQAIRLGFVIGTLNQRGVHYRQEGGNQEHELANRYRDWAKRRSHSYPFVGSILDAIAREYEARATWYDDHAHIERRLEN